MTLMKNASRYCAMCDKARKACICGFIESIDNSVPVIILQHPSEGKKSIGTARILNLSLSQCELFVGEDFSTHTALQQKLSDKKTHYVILFPTKEAKPVTEYIQEKGVNKKDLGIILIDGTWKKAYKILALSTNLHLLPAITLDSIYPSRYKIRKTVKKNGLSTLEAAYYLLTTLDKNKDRYTSLMTAFEKMIDFQIQQMPVDVYKQHYE